MIITSRQNAKIKHIVSLKDKKYRTQYSEYVVEGIKMVKEALLCGIEVKEIAGTLDALAELPENNVPVIETTDEVFAYISDTKSPQGVLAVLAIPENKLTSPNSNCAVLDGISDPGNLGTIIRTCAAVGIKDIYLCSCADAFSPKTVRSSMSGIFFTELHSCDRDTVINLVKDNTLVVGDMAGENIFNSEVVSPYAIVIGNEANGVSDFFRKRADITLSIPMSKNVESLNAAVSFSVIAYLLMQK